jgi:hypothetical protein
VRKFALPGGVAAYMSPSRGSRRLLLRGTLTVLATLGLAASARADIGADTVALKLDSHAPAGSSSSVTTPDVLTAGRLYAVTVSGTYTAEAANAWSPTSSYRRCGTPDEGGPAEPSVGQPPRPAAIDAFSTFAAVVASGAPCPPLPARNGAFQFDLGTGSRYLLTPLNVASDSAAPRADHTYVYVVRGQGHALETLVDDVNPRDNDGVLSVGVRLATAADCYGNATCLAQYAQSTSGSGTAPGSQIGPSGTATSPSTGSTPKRAKCSTRPKHGIVVHFRRTSAFVSATILLAHHKHSKRVHIARRDRHHGWIRLRRAPRSAFTVRVRGHRRGSRRTVLIAKRRVLVACPRHK